MRISSTNPIDEAVYQMFVNDDRMKLMQEAMKSIAKPNSTQDLVDFVMNGLE